MTCELENLPVVGKNPKGLGDAQSRFSHFPLPAVLFEPMKTIEIPVLFLELLVLASGMTPTERRIVSYLLLHPRMNHTILSLMKALDLEEARIRLALDSDLFVIENDSISLSNVKLEREPTEGEPCTKQTPDHDHGQSMISTGSSTNSLRSLVEDTSVAPLRDAAPKATKRDLTFVKSSDLIAVWSQEYQKAFGKQYKVHPADRKAANRLVSVMPVTEIITTARNAWRCPVLGGFLRQQSFTIHGFDSRCSEITALVSDQQAKTLSAYRSNKEIWAAQ